MLENTQKCLPSSSWLSPLSYLERERLREPLLDLEPLRDRLERLLERDLREALPELDLEWLRGVFGATELLLQCDTSFVYNCQFETQ